LEKLRQIAVDHPVPLTRHDSQSHNYEGCSQKALAPLATLSLPLLRRRFGEHRETTREAQPDNACASTQSTDN
jgi:hypothetical protein